MIYKPADKLYNDRFRAHVLAFSRRLNLLGRDAKVVVALSGGEDSMSLLHFFHELKERGEISGLRVIHIHHGTRVSQDEEEKIVRLYCDALRIKLQVFYLHDLKDSKNFEFEARKRRYQIFQEGTFDKELVATGHHLDDSFEWSLMQSFKSSEVTSSLGIPAKRGKFIRPFLSVSKKQIEKYRKNLDLPFVKDPTNASVQFERNDLRKNLIPLIAKKYPHYLKHYARRQNALAQKLFKGKEANKGHLVADNMLWLNFKVVPEASVLIENLKKGLKTFTDLRWRAGNQHEQFSNMIAQQKIGPMHLPGKLSCYLHSGFIAVLPNSHRFLGPGQVLFLQESFDAFSKKFHEALKNPTLIAKYPLFVALEIDFKGLKIHRKHPLWPKLSEWGELNSLHITDSRSLLDWWTQVKDSKKTLRLAYLW